MTFASKALESASERFFLVKMTSRRYLYLGQLTAPNTYIYTVPENLNIESVIINGEAISSSNYVYSNNQLQITSALNLLSTSNVVTLDHNIFLTGTKQRETSGISGLPNAIWQPLIRNYPNFSQSMANIAEGVFTLSNTNIDFICTDRWAQALVGKPEEITGQYESLSRSPIFVWACIDSYEDNRKIFDGEVTSASYNNGIFSLSIIDTFQKLTNSASFGTRAQSQIYTGNGSQFPKIEDENSIVTITMGKSSPISVSPGYRHVDPFGSPPCPLYHISDCKQAKLIGPQNANQTSTTTWHAGRIVGTDIKKINFGTVIGDTLVFRLKQTVEQETTFYGVISEDNVTELWNFQLINNIFFVRLSNINDFTGEIGDYIPGTYLPTGFKNLYAHVAGFGPNLYGSYNLALVATETQIDDGDPTDYPNLNLPAMSLPNNTIPSMSVILEGGDSSDYKFNAFLAFGQFDFTIRDRSSFYTRHMPFTYSLGTAYTIGGQTVRDVYFTLNASTKVNIASSTVKCRFSPNQTMTHADALKFIVRSSGMDVNDASFTQAAADLSANVSVTYPLDNAGEFSNYLETAQSITNSTLGLLRVNQDRQVEYKVIKNPNLAAASGVRDSVNMLDGRTQASIQYQDMISSVNFENPQLKTVNSPATSVVDFPVIKQLHRVEKTKNIKHVLDSIQNRKNAIAGYFANPTVEYSLATASEDLASSIGDVIQINNKVVADKNETTKGVIVSLDQSGSTTSIKVNEIRGVD